MTEQTFGMDAIIQFPTGAIKASTLDRILSTMPFEIGFCDDKDIFRFYSNQPNRINRRRVEAIGKNAIEDLHPGEKRRAHTEKLLHDFHTGAKDTWEFWFPSKDGRQIFQKFIAVKDPEGNYLGSMDVVMDVTALQDKREGKQTPDTLDEFKSNPLKEKGDEILAQAKAEVEAEEKAEAPVAGMDDYIAFPTGTIQVRVLDAILSCLPYEMGFCDQDDIFRWYTNNPNRVHARRVEAIGLNAVTDLHPKVREHTRKLLDDFRTGTRRDWEFWFPKRSGQAGQTYQRFIAVHDENGKYLGCMDVTLNLDLISGKEEGKHTADTISDFQKVVKE